MAKQGNIKKTLIAFGFLTSCIFFMQAQDADNNISNVINHNDWFALDEVLPQMENDIQTPFLKTMAKVLRAFYFNQPETFLAEFDTLLTFQNELGFNNISAFTLMKANVLCQMGRYREGVEFSQNFINRHIDEYGEEKFSYHFAFLNNYENLVDVPQPALVRPNKNVEIPLKIKQFDVPSKKYVRAMYVPVKIRGKEYQFLFDTGATMSMVSEEIAKEIGLKIVDDSFKITGVCSAIGKIGVLDKLSVGEIEYQNSLFIVAPPIEAVDTIVKIDAVLGIDFMKAVGEMQIFPKENKIVFPAKQTPQPDFGSNLYFENKRPLLKTAFGNETLKLIFDTGNTGHTFLQSTYYQKHKSIFDLFGTKETAHSGGFGCIKEIEVYKLPEIQLTVGNQHFTQKQVQLHLENSGDNEDAEDGNIGMVFVELWDQITLNFDKMFVEMTNE
ncbi:MAG: retroviral-like aspartic protease family protein [Dysgonamonadaceae bacterium]|jgi:hypothetical protein|nr:retroviral-like aspartic protease family protein [Dysgonamonadaceae bacterium]